MSDWNSDVPALVTELEDQIEDGIKVLGSVDTATMSDADVAALDALTKAKDFLQQLVTAMGLDDPGSGNQDNNSDANTGRADAATGVPERRGTSSEALHLIHTNETLCGRVWIGHPEVRVRSAIGYVTCRECKRKAAEVARTG